MPTKRPERVVICPCPPLLLPDSGGLSAQDDLGELRACAARAIDWLREPGHPVLVLFNGSPGLLRNSTPVSARSFGLTFRGVLGAGSPTADDQVTPREPGVLVAAHLLAGHAAQALGVRDIEQGFAAASAIEARAVLVMGGGSARRRDGAPGHVDERAVPYDDALAGELMVGNVSGLAELDRDVAGELLVDVAVPLAVAARLCAGAAVTAHLDHYDAPYGVANYVARWSL